jgi:hypothetical protein
MNGITNNTTFYLSVVDTNTTCSKTDSVQLSVYSYQTQFPVITENAGVLSCTPAHFYQWYLDSVPIANATTQTYTPTAEGVYTVAVSDSAVCDYYTSVGFNFLFTNMATSNFDKVSFDIFPNPTTDLLNIKSNVVFNNATISIVDLLGNIIVTEKLSIQNSKFRIQNLTPGVYFIIIKANNIEYTHKIIKY